MPLYYSLFKLFLYIVTISSVAAAPTPKTHLLKSRQWSSATTKHWHGWNKITDLFALYASTSQFIFTLFLLTIDNSGASYTSTASGPNYISYLTAQYSSSSIQLHDLAFAGAEIDMTATGSWSSTNDMVHQISSLSTNTQSSFASPDSTLYLSFFGINDIYNTYSSWTPVEQIIESYRRNLESLYNSYSSRNFLILNIPPLDLSPAFNNDPVKAEAVGNVVLDFNSRIPAMLDELYQSYPDGTWLWYDTHALFEQLLEDPASVPGITNVRGSCDAYEGSGYAAEGPTLGESDSECEGFFWLNGLHPTEAVHRIWAQQIAGGLVDAQVF